MHTDFITLKLFLAVAEEHSFAKAAQREHISTPAISKRISDLEESLGVVLLTRSSTGVTVTSAGEALTSEVKNILTGLERMRSRLSSYSEGQTGEVRILFSPSGCLGNLPAILREFASSYPSVDICLEEVRAVQVVRGVLKGHADIGVFARNLATKDLSMNPGLRVEVFECHRLVLVVKADHLLAKRSSVGLADVPPNQCIGFTPESPLGSVMEQVFAKAGLDGKTKLHVTNFETAKKMIEAGLGIGILPEASVKSYPRVAGLRCVHLSDEWANYYLDVCVRADDVMSKPGKILLEKMLVKEGI